MTRPQSYAHSHFSMDMTRSQEAVPRTSNTENTPASSGSVFASSIPLPRRKVVGFVRSEPGYRISVIIDAFLLLNGLLFGILAVVAGTTDVNGPVQVADEYETYDIIGMSLFCLWNSIVWSMILLFPSITTTNRESVKSMQCSQYLFLIHLFVFIFFQFILEFNLLLFEWHFSFPY